MVCNFCGDPAAHPATGCVYGQSTIACYTCVTECWAWVRQHTNSSPPRFVHGSNGIARLFAREMGVLTAFDFYGAAGRRFDGALTRAHD
jgi:hypothetical protein